MMAILIGLIISLLVSAVVIWIVGRLNLGLSVSSFTNALLAAIVIAVVNAVAFWLLGALGVSVGAGLSGVLVLLVIATVVLMISDRFLPGFTVNGFTGAIVAAIAIAVVSWLVGWLLVLLGITA